MRAQKKRGSIVWASFLLRSENLLGLLSVLCIYSYQLVVCDNRVLVFINSSSVYTAEHRLVLFGLLLLALLS